MMALKLNVICCLFVLDVLGYENQKFLFYDTTYQEGFNLRRDVYIRIVNFVRKLNDADNWTIVLPPWSNVYHWRTENVIFWRNLFDLDAMNKVVNIIEDDKFISSNKHSYVDVSFILKNHPDTNFGDFTPKIDLVKCRNGEEEQQIYRIIPVHNNICLNVRADISEFAEFFQSFVNKQTKFKYFYLHNAEKLIHGKYSEWSDEYWTVRRSMVFSQHLRGIGNEFRILHLNSSDDTDKTLFSHDWRIDRRYFSIPKGGPYISAHLRRADFIWNREIDHPTTEEIIFDISKLCDIYNLKTVFMATDTTSLVFFPTIDHPTTEEIIFDISKLCDIYNLKTVFMATDTTSLEKEILKSRALDLNITLLFYSNSNLHPGEVAIIDQWIASHGRAFIGTFQSTFTFRIIEERQIMGFVPSTSHNLFCPDRLRNLNTEEECCSKPSIWPVKWESQFTLHDFGSKSEL